MFGPAMQELTMWREYSDRLCEAENNRLAWQARAEQRRFLLPCGASWKAARITRALIKPVEECAVRREQFASS
jgi:hypothetical protein